VLLKVLQAKAVRAIKPFAAFSLHYDKDYVRLVAQCG
jgi:hypothetical protein